jgi:hypothetical protein
MSPAFETTLPKCVSECLQARVCLCSRVAKTPYHTQIIKLLNAYAAACGNSEVAAELSTLDLSADASSPLADPDFDRLNSILERCVVETVLAFCVQLTCTLSMCSLTL